MLFFFSVSGEHHAAIHTNRGRSTLGGGGGSSSSSLVPMVMISATNHPQLILPFLQTFTFFASLCSALLLLPLSFLTTTLFGPYLVHRILDNSNNGGQQGQQQQRQLQFQQQQQQRWRALTQELLKSTGNNSRSHSTRKPGVVCTFGKRSASEYRETFQEGKKGRIPVMSYQSGGHCVKPPSCIGG